MYREASFFYFKAHFFWCSLFLKNISTPRLRTCLPPLSFKISLKDISFHIYLNSLGFYLSRMVVEFSVTCIYHQVWEKSFNLWCSHSKKMHWIYAFLLMPQFLSLGRIFWKSVCPKTKKVEKTMICFIKIQSENIKMTWNIRLFIFYMIYNFYKCDGFTVL